MTTTAMATAMTKAPPPSIEAARTEAARTDASTSTAPATGAESQLAMRIGSAGWSIPRAWRDAFANPDDLPAQVGQGSPVPASDGRAGASHLEKYARRFSAVEINSSFYRHHRRTTYERWAAAVPSDFRFAVKLPRTITHDQSLVAFDAPLDVFLEEVSGLGDRLGPLLVQLPPSLPFDEGVANEFFAGLRAMHGGDVVCEPRHPTWFEDDADALLSRYQVARVAADPACVPAAARPGGSSHLVYARLHGSPHMYRSSYASAFLEQIGEMLVTAQRRADGLARGGPTCMAEAWCIFDNTTLGAATGNALELLEIMNDRRRR